MIEKHAMQGLLKEMERAAQEVLQQDSAFFEALQALKWEIDGDRRVQSAVRRLQAAGQRVFSSFVPRIKVRIRTEEGVFAMAKPPEMPSAPALDPVTRLTQELKNAASTVIMKSRHCRELETIVNEAVAASDTFERTASQVEKAGHEVLISLDLSAYAHVQGPSAAPDLDRLEPPSRQESTEPVNLQFSAHDLQFLKKLRIQAG